MKTTLQRALDALKKGESLTLSSVPDGFDALVVADLARGLSGAVEGPAVLVHVARDGQRQQTLKNALDFIAPELEVLTFPAWDCQPYDRVSPNTSVTAQRMTTLARLARSRSSEARPRILSTTVNAARPARAAARPDRIRDVLCGPGQRRSTPTSSSRGSRPTDSCAPAPSAMRANTPSAAASSICFPPGCRTRCASTSSATRSNRSAPSIRRRSARPAPCARLISCR